MQRDIMPLGNNTDNMAYFYGRTAAATGMCRPLNRYGGEPLPEGALRCFAGTDATVPTLYSHFASNFSGGAGASGGGGVVGDVGAFSYPHHTADHVPVLSYRESLLSRLHGGRGNAFAAAGHPIYMQSAAASPVPVPVPVPVPILVPVPAGLARAPDTASSLLSRAAPAWEPPLFAHRATLRSATSPRVGVCPIPVLYRTQPPPQQQQQQMPQPPPFFMSGAEPHSPFGPDAVSISYSVAVPVPVNGNNGNAAGAMAAAHPWHVDPHALCHTHSAPAPLIAAPGRVAAAPMPVFFNARGPSMIPSAHSSTSPYSPPSAHSSHSSHPSAGPVRHRRQRQRQRQEAAFWELFDRLAFRPERRPFQRRAPPHPAAHGADRFHRSAGPRRAGSDRYAHLMDRAGMTTEPSMPAHFALDEEYALQAALAPNVDEMSYEELLALAERIGNVACGVSRERLKQLRVVLQLAHFDGLPPAVKRKRVKTESQAAHAHPHVQKMSFSFSESSESEETPLLSCCVCLDGFSVGDAALQLPCCRHFLHEGCGARCFESQFRCPICTRDVRSTS